MNRISHQGTATKSGTWKYWKSNSSSSQPIWRRGKSCPILVKTKAGWENPGGANPADTARGNKAHVDRSVRWQVTERCELDKKSERCLGSLRRAPAQDKELKARQTEAGEESMFDEDRQKHLCSHPFHFTHWSVIQDAGTCSSSVRKQSNCKVLQAEVLRLHSGLCSIWVWSGSAQGTVSVRISHQVLPAVWDSSLIQNLELASGIDDNSMLMSATLSAQVTVIWVLGLKTSDLVNHFSLSLGLKHINCHKIWMWKRLQQQAPKI